MKIGREILFLLIFERYKVGLQCLK